MHALRTELLPPSGVEYVTSLNLTPACLSNAATQASSSSAIRSDSKTTVLCNLAVARSNLLRVFEVREEPAPPPSAEVDAARERNEKVRKGTEAFEGEVEMDEHLEGYVTMGGVKSTALSRPPTITRLYLVREHHLHGVVTGMDAIKTVATLVDKLDRLLLSFKDAKIALLEWSESAHDLITVSIHTYERAPQLMVMEAPLFRTKLQVEPSSRCAALSLPKDSIAILPFYQTQADLDVMDQDQYQARNVPYSPSFILDLATDVDKKIQNVLDFVFLPGFNSPTIAILFQHEQTWTGRLKEYKDTSKLIIFTLDLVMQSYHVITYAEGLAYDSMYLLPCDAALGGVIVVSSNALIYVDQAARKVALPVNGWPTRISDMTFLPVHGQDLSRDLELEGSFSVFVDDNKFFVFLKDGSVYPVEIVADGKNVSKLNMGASLARTTIPSTVRKIGTDHIFVGSLSGPSVLLRTARVEEKMEASQAPEPGPAAVVDVAMSNSMDLSDDEDIYGPSIRTSEQMTGIAIDAAGQSITRSVIHLSLSDTIPGYGPVMDLTFSISRFGERTAPELVAATGSGSLGGFTLFQRDLPIHTKRKLHAIGGARGVWSMPIRQSVKVNGVSYEKTVNPYQTENDTVIFSTDATPSPGLSRIASRSSKGDITITNRIPGLTIGAGPFFQRTAILHVMINTLRVLEADGTERQMLKDMDSNINRAKIKACSICDPFLLVMREDETIGLFIATEHGRIRRKDMSPMGEKASRYIAGCFFTDTSGLLEAKTKDDDNSITSTLPSVMSSTKRTQWLVLVRPQGILEIWSLPKLTLVFSSPLFSTLHNVVPDSFDGPASSVSHAPDASRKPEPLEIDQILLTSLGQSSPRPYLLVYLRSGQLAIYEAFPSLERPPESSKRTAWLPIAFNRVFSRAFNVQKQEEFEKTILAEQKRISHMLIPFLMSPAPGICLSGVFLTGDRPSWIVATDKGGVRVIPSGHTVVYSFTASSLWESKSEFLLYSDEGPSLASWIPDVDLTLPLPMRHIPLGRAYTHVRYDATTSTIVAASIAYNKFTSYDEDNSRIWEPDASNISDPRTECSTLELISPNTWTVVHGYEFAPNEFVNCIDSVMLETNSVEAGYKEFIAVGTSINRGEDLAVKGVTYIFELVEVVPDPSISMRRQWKLKLRVRDESKNPVTALCGINGYLVSSMGQKVFVRAFDNDERLVGVAFLDAGVYIHSLRSLKNLILIGDAVKSVLFVAFQEDPFKLVILSRDVYQINATMADFFFDDQGMNILTGDDEGVLRLYEYNPEAPESKNGQRLLCNNEFHCQIEQTSRLVIARRLTDDIVLSKFIFGAIDGSISMLAPIDENTAKRFQLLQGQLTRNVQHVAGLNPKANRIVRNDYVSKPLSKGILDGGLLSIFEALSIPRQDEMTRQIGTERAAILKDWDALADTPW